MDIQTQVNEIETRKSIAKINKLKTTNIIKTILRYVHINEKKNWTRKKTEMPELTKAEKSMAHIGSCVRTVRKICNQTVPPLKWINFLSHKT